MNNKVLLDQIKKLKKANQRLRKENSGLNNVLNSIDHAIIYTDLKGVIIDMNKAAEDLTGYTKEMSRGKFLNSIFKFINNYTEKPVPDLIDKIAGEKSVKKYTNEGLLISKNGEKNPIRISGAKINYNQNKNILIEFRRSKNKYIDQKKLHELGERYRQIFNKANDAIYIHNLTDQGMPGNFIEVNPKACEMLGYSKDEFGKMTPLDIDTMDSRARLPEIMQNLLKKGHHTFEVKHKAKNKKIIPVEISSHLFTLNNKKLILSIARDISKRRQAENKLRISQERLSVIYESSPVSITLSSLDSGKFVKVNPAFTEITGWKREETIGKTAFELGIWGARPEKRREKLLDKLKNNNSVKDLKLRFYDRHKNEIIALLSAEIVYVSGEEYILAIVIDITERERIRIALQEREEEFRTLINATPDIIIFKDDKGRWIHANQSILELFSLTEVDYKGKTDLELAQYIDPVARQDFLTIKKRDEEAWKSGSFIRYEKVIPRTGGEKKIFDIIKVPIFTDNNIRKGLVVLGRDITDRKRSEKKYQYIWEKAKDGMLLTNKEGKVIKVNQVLCEMVELNRQDLEGNPFTAFYRKNKIRILEEYITRFKNKNIPKRVEKKVRLHNGKFRWFEIVNSFLNIPGEQDQLLAIYRNITKRKNLENSIKVKNQELLSLNKLSIIINKSLDPERVLNTALKEIVSILNADGGVIFSSPGSKNIFSPGYDINISPDLLAEIKVIEKGQYLAGSIAQNRKPEIISDLEEYKDIVPDIALEKGWKSYAGFPIIINNEILGVISIASYKKNNFKNVATEILDRIGFIVGIAIKNSQLYTNLKHALRQQEKTEDQLHKLISHLTGVEENFRKKAARKIHDEIGQKLTALSFNITSLKQNIGKESEKSRADDCLNLIKSTIDDTNNILKELAPSILYEQGLFTAIERYIEKFIHRTGININLKGQRLSEKLPNKHKINIYRSFQEILNNIAKHSRAENVIVTLKVIDNSLLLKIKDDGIGFNTEKISQQKNHNNFGIRGMKERIMMLDGELKIDSTPGKGTKITIKVKLS